MTTRSGALQSNGEGFSAGRPSELHPTSIARTCHLPLQRHRNKAYSWDDLLNEAVDAYWDRRPATKRVAA